MSTQARPDANPEGSFLKLAAGIVDRAMEYATRKELRISVVVLDATFTPVFASRIDGAFASTFPVATAKAHTAMNFGAPTHELKARVAPENQTALSGVEPRLMFVGGGLPILREGHTIGAVGVSGGSEEQDVQCALNGIGALRP